MSPSRSALSISPSFFFDTQWWTHWGHSRLSGLSRQPSPSLLDRSPSYFHDCQVPQETQYSPSSVVAGLSLSDMISSFAMAFASTLRPRWLLGLKNSMGNMGLCHAQGFSFIFIFGQLASSFYNCSLCVCYLFELRFTKWRESLGTIEAYLHFSSCLDMEYHNFGRNGSQSEFMLAVRRLGHIERDEIETGVSNRLTLVRGHGSSSSDSSDLSVSFN